MIHRKNSPYGNDSHTIMYFNGNETMIGDPFGLGGGTFGESSYLNQDIHSTAVAQSTSQSRFGSKSYLWGTSTSSGIGLSARTDSQYNFRELDYSIDFWVYFNSGTTGYFDFLGIVDRSDTTKYLVIQAYPSGIGTCYWYLRIQNGTGVQIVDFSRQSNDFNFHTWYHICISRKSTPSGESYSIYAANPSVSHISHWLTGATNSFLFDFNWTNPTLFVGTNLGGGPTTNLYVDSFRISRSNARMFATTTIGIKPTYSIPNRDY